MGAESWSDSALSWRVHRAHPLFIPALLRSSTVPSRGITGLRGGSSLCLSARRGSSCPGLARSPLQGHELGMASPVLHGRLGGGRRTGEAWGQLRSSHLLKEPFKGRLMGPSEGTRGPSPCFCRGPGAPLALAGSQGQLGRSRTEQEEAPQESPAERKQQGKVHITSKLCVHYCWRNRPQLREPALGKSNAAR